MNQACLFPGLASSKVLPRGHLRFWSSAFVTHSVLGFRCFTFFSTNKSITKTGRIEKDSSLWWENFIWSWQKWNCSIIITIHFIAFFMNWINNGFFSFLWQFFSVPNEFMYLFICFHLIELIWMGYDLLWELYAFCWNYYQECILLKLL